MKHLTNTDNSHTSAFRQELKARGFRVALWHLGLAALIGAGDLGWRWLARKPEVQVDSDVLTIRVNAESRGVAVSSNTVAVSNCHLIRVEGGWFIRKP